MKKIVLSLALIFLSYTVFAQVWETQNSGVAVTIRDVCFVDSLNGWAVGDSSTILSTVDGGIKWNLKKFSLPNKSFFRIQFLSKNIGYIIGSNSLILTTRDAGNTWNIITHNLDLDFTDLIYLNENEGWITGNKVF